MPITPTQHRYNVLASNVLFATFFLTIPINYITKQGYFDQTMAHSSYVALWVLTPLIFGWYYLIRRGRRWAMILLVVTFISNLAFFAWRFDHMAPKLFATPLRTFSYLMQQVAQLVVVVLILLSLFNRTPPEPALAPEA